MRRRDLLKLSLGALAAGPLAGSLLRAAVRRPARPPRRLVLVLAQGGWDTTYALDPKVGSATVDVPAGVVQPFGDLDVFTDGSRPSVDKFFLKYGAQTAIVRGISVASVAHIECAKRMTTGTLEATNPDMGAIVGHDLGNDLPMPYLILGDTAYTGPYAASAGRVGATNQILALLDPAQRYQTGSATPFVTSPDEDWVIDDYARASAERLRATRGAQGYNRRRVDDFVASIDRAKQLVAARSGFGSRGGSLQLDRQVTLAVRALGEDISQAVMLSTRVLWDTHAVNSAQSASHETTFAGLVQLLDALSTWPGRQSGTTMLDDTVVVCFSELGRTPKLNAALGKDHWPVTTALVMGAGVKGGQVFGRTTAELRAMPIDLATGAPSATGTTLMSQHFVGGILELCGVDPAAHLAGEVLDAFVA